MKDILSLTTTKTLIGHGVIVERSEVDAAINNSVEQWSPFLGD